MQLEGSLCSTVPHSVHTRGHNEGMDLNRDLDRDRGGDRGGTGVRGLELGRFGGSGSGSGSKAVDMVGSTIRCPVR